MKKSAITIPREALAGLIPVGDDSFEIQLRDGFYFEDFLDCPSIRVADSRQDSVKETDGKSAQPASGYLGIELLPRQQFRFRGRVYTIKGETQFLIFSAMVNGGGKALFSDLGRDIWGDDCRPRKKISDALRSVRKKLQSLGTGLTVTEKSEIGYLILRGMGENHSG